MIAIPLLSYLGNMKNNTTNRRPHSNLAGYICELRNRRTGIGHVVIYLAKEQQLDESYGKYAVSCEAHNVFTQTTSLPKARAIMKAVDFCEECMSYGR